MSNELRDGIVGLNTRQFGRVVELIIKFIYKQKDSKDLAFDLIDGNIKIEVKAARVYRANKLDITIENLYDLIISNSNKNRLIKQSEINSQTFDCNIQQIKVKYFDYLYYVLFFNDIIEIYKIKSNRIVKDKKIQYSDKQHRGNSGEGQFHISNTNYLYHKENYFLSSLKYDELKEKLLQKKKISANHPSA